MKWDLAVFICVFLMATDAEVPLRVRCEKNGVGRGGSEFSALPLRVSGEREAGLWQACLRRPHGHSLRRARQSRLSDGTQAYAASQGHVLRMRRWASSS